MTNPTAAKTGKGSPPPRWALKALTKTHVFLHRASGGRLFNTLGGDDVCFITMTGAKSGNRITIPLMHIPHRDGILLVASQGGAPKNPVWYHNLVKHPEIEVRHRKTQSRLSARLAEESEKDELWPVCDAAYADFAVYRERTERSIPIFVCEPG